MRAWGGVERIGLDLTYGTVLLAAGGGCWGILRLAHGVGRFGACAGGRKNQSSTLALCRCRGTRRGTRLGSGLEMKTALKREVGPALYLVHHATPSSSTCMRRVSMRYIPLILRKQSNASNQVYCRFHRCPPSCCVIHLLRQDTHLSLSRFTGAAGALAANEAKAARAGICADPYLCCPAVSADADDPGLVTDSVNGGCELCCRG